MSGPEEDEAFVSRFPVHRACRDGDVGALVTLVQQLSNRSLLTAEDSLCGWTPIHWAAHYGQLECVVRLVQMGCEVNRATSRFSQTPTHTAAFGGHPHCVVWLTQAGADVNKQDFVVSAAGKLARLRNASGQTAADLAHAHGFHDCFCFISDAQKFGGLHSNTVPNGDVAPCGQAVVSRKRQLAAVDAEHMKKARRAEGVLVLEELESMNLELSSDVANGDPHTSPPAVHDDAELHKSPLPPSSASSAPSRRAPAEMCGSLHLSGSPGGCASRWPTGADCGDVLHYGHYHGFGDTAEELGDGGCVPAEHAPKRAADGAVHLYHA